MTPTPQDSAERDPREGSSADASTPRVHHQHWLDLEPRTAYELARLRFGVFAMGQGITSEQDLDGVDLLPETETLWIENDDAVPVATLRIFRDSSGVLTIGRVATDAAHRGRGLAGRLLASAIELHPGEVIELHAQAYLEQWYARFGFTRHGGVFQEAGIPHVLMRRTGSEDAQH